MFLEILQNSQKIIFARISFLIKLQGGNLKLSETSTGDAQYDKMFLKILQVSEGFFSKKVEVLRACNFI